MELPGYRIDRVIEHNNETTLFRGQQLSARRPVAIRVVNQSVTRKGTCQQAFEMDARLLARLCHPNIIQIYDRGLTHEDNPFLVMEYFDGVDLNSLLTEKRLDETQKLTIALQVTKALSYAHRNGVIHQGINPGTIILKNDLTAKLVDFGISGLNQARKDNTSNPFSACLAPELQNSSATATAQSDIYALGITLRQMFEPLPIAAAKNDHTDDAGPAKGLCSLINDCIHNDPAKRPQSCDEVLDRLRFIQHGQHLTPQQKETACGIFKQKNYTLLDIFSEDNNKATYLFADQTNSRKLIIKQRELTTENLSTSQKLCQLHHPNIARLHAASKNRGKLILVQEYLASGNLQERLLQPFDLTTFTAIATHIITGLQFAHQHQVYHGNIRAENILFDTDGNVKISDFGLADFTPGTAPSNNETGLPNNTPSSAAADIFACGIIFYRMLIGALPRWHQSKLEKGRALMRLPHGLRDMLIKMLDQQPENRYHNCDAILAILKTADQDLDTIAKQPKQSRRERKRIRRQEDNKKILLLLLLVIMFQVMLNTGAIVLFGGDEAVQLSDPATWTNLISHIRS